MGMTKINWYPGHMKKTKDMIKENMQIIDIVLELVDARIPISSMNPEIKTFAKNKKRLIILNKSDLVTKEHLKSWKDYFLNHGNADDVIDISAEKGTNMKLLFKKIDELSKDKIDKMKKKGLKKVNIRLMVAGIPNVGKSKLINRIVGKNKAGVGNKPGFTRGKQWVKIKDGLELLDTPGILWPKFEDDKVGYNLAIAGAIRDEILPLEEVAEQFIIKLRDINKLDIIKKPYGLNDDDLKEHPLMILDIIARNGGMIKKGDIPDRLAATFKVLRDYRAARLGKFPIEYVDEYL